MNINEALGDVRRPLQVGDWVECVNANECDELEEASWPKQIKFIDDGVWVGFDSDQRGEWGMRRFRRVDPPTSEVDEVAEVAELRRQLAEANERDEYYDCCHDLRQKVVQLERERDELRDQSVMTIHGLTAERNALSDKLAVATERMQCGHLRPSIVTSVESNSNWCGECDMQSRLSDAVQMEKHNKEQWDREKERRVYYQNIVYAVCNLLDSHLGYTPGQGIVTGTAETPSTMVADTLEKVLFRCRQLDTAEADAAAMRRTMTENESRLKDVIRRIGVSTTTGWITHELNHVLLDIPSGTAGRELLDRHKAKLAAKDAEIEQERKLSRSCMSQNARLVRKSRTAKTALFEHYRGKIDPAWFGEKSELYKYRTTANPSGVIWRTSDGKSCEASMVGHAWITATAYSSWQECCDDKRTYPCNADGTPLAKPTKDFAEAIEQLLEKDPKLKLEVEAASEEIRQEQSDDDAMLRKLRELLKQCDVCVCLEKEFKIRGPSYDIANETLVTLIAIRDGGGK